MGTLKAEADGEERGCEWIKPEEQRALFIFFDVPYEVRTAYTKPKTRVDT
jgi:hypothetical protein